MTKHNHLARNTLHFYLMVLNVIKNVLRIIFTRLLLKASYIASQNLYIFTLSQYLAFNLRISHPHTCKPDIQNSSLVKIQFKTWDILLQFPGGNMESKVPWTPQNPSLSLQGQSAILQVGPLKCYSRVTHKKTKTTNGLAEDESP